MIAIKSKIVFLIFCIFETVFLLLSQVSGNTLILLVCLGMFLSMSAYAAVKGMAIPLLLYFLPFAALLKLQPGTISFYTLALLVVYAISMVLGSKRINILHLVPGLCLVALALAVKTFSGYSIDNTFILFSFSLLSVPFVSRELDDKYDFYWLTMCFALGIVVASITARYLVVFPSIRQYIETLNILGMTRYSGYYGDPNFYSAHITAALSGVLILFLNNSDKKRMAYLILMSLALVYCGFMSVSKSFMLITVCLMLFWIVEFMFQKGKMSAKLTIIMTMIVGLIFLLSSTVFSDSVTMMISRFSGNVNLSDLTTGRTELWMQYFREFIENPLVLVFGKGLSNVLVNDRASHNTVIQLIYQFGLLGCVLMAGWIICFVRTLLNGVRFKWSNLTQTFIVMLGAFGPWMALDLLKFDEFFLLPIYVCMAVRFMNKNGDAEETLMQKEERIF